ncbi:hypothetical protein J6V86_02105 [bacterium]|nr:hypothetical protein [bacterium]
MIIFSIINHNKIPHNIYNAILSVYQYSSTVSHNKCKKASHINVPAEKAIKYISICFNFSVEIQSVTTQISDTQLIINMLTKE